MRCVAACGGEKGRKRKRQDPLVLRSGLLPNRAATVYWLGGGSGPLSFSFALFVSCFLSFS